jgi:hypothetical protein
MSWRLLPGLILVVAGLTACSWGAAKRTGYETVESMRVQQCLDRRDDPDCPTERQRYESYESQQQRDTRE